jgi:transcriptional regulator with XRE-family HTH domain
MVERSLQASQDRIALAKSPLIGRRLTQQALADALSVTRQPISRFFNGKAIDRDLFVRICEYLGLDWQAIVIKTEAESKESAEDIDRLVHEVREGIRSLVKERCGTMRVLDMHQPVALTGERGIYTNVNIFEQLSGRRSPEDITPVLRGEFETFDRFGLGRVTALLHE